MPNKIGVISDLHGSLEDTKNVLEILESTTDLLICAGDILYHGPRNHIPKNYNPEKVAELINKFPKKIIFARGNCDAEVDQALIKYPILQDISFVFIEKVHIAITHGHKIPNNNFDQFGSNNKINILVTGHTHIPLIENFSWGIYLNPGSIALPKNRFNKSYAIINIENGKFNAEIKEMK